MSETVSFDLEVECSDCGSSLGASFRNGILKVDNCEKCVESEKEKSFDAGKDKGYEQAHQET